MTQDVVVFVEVPSDSRNKYELELRNEVEHVFQVYKDLEEAKVETHGFGNRADAVRVLAEARERAAAPTRR